MPPKSDGRPGIHLLRPADHQCHRRGSDVSHQSSELRKALLDREKCTRRGSECGARVSKVDVTKDLDTLATLSVKTDDLLKASPELTDAEPVALAVTQALLRFKSERRWLRHARKNLVPVPTRTIRSQQASAEGIGVDQVRDPTAVDRHHAVIRRRVGGRFHAGRVWPIEGDGEPGRRRRARPATHPRQGPGRHPGPQRRLRCPVRVSYPSAANRCVSRTASCQPP